MKKVLNKAVKSSWRDDAFGVTMGRLTVDPLKIYKKREDYYEANTQAWDDYHDAYKPPRKSELAWDEDYQGMILSSACAGTQDTLTETSD